jgi:hypothetical protein
MPDAEVWAWLGRLKAKPLPGYVSGSREETTLTSMLIAVQILWVNAIRCTVVVLRAMPVAVLHLLGYSASRWEWRFLPLRAYLGRAVFRHVIMARAKWSMAR